MQGKTVIGNQSNAADQALVAEQRATIAESNLTMTQRRIRTFYAELTEVQFPDSAADWAPDWLEWLLTGEVVAEIIEEPTVEMTEGQAAAETAEIVFEAPVEGVGTPAA